MKPSELDGLCGLGPSRTHGLVEEFGSVKKVKAASLDEPQTLSWLPDPVPEELWNELHRPRG